MLTLRPYTGPTKLILAFDIGTIYSRVSYCILEPRQIPEVFTVARFPAQGVARADARVPSLVYYNEDGTVRAAGAEVLIQDVNETMGGWKKAEWWKLHLCPNHFIPSVNDIPPLPSGKSAVDVLADFLKYLVSCCKTYIEECHPAFAWSSVENSIEYILTYPSSWGEQRYLYRQATERAGLVPSTPEGQLRVHTLTEGEAVLHFCIAHSLDREATHREAPKGVVIIDAGGGIIDVSMFSTTVDPFSFEEIAPAKSHLEGSISVTRRAKALVEKKLKGWEHSRAEDIARFTRKFDQTTKLIIESDQETAYIEVAGRRTNNSKYCISSGRLKLSGKEATSLFNESINAIIDAFQTQQNFHAIPITTVFVIGGFSENEWLWSQLQSYFRARDINIYRPDNFTIQAVANGAVLSHVYRSNHLIVPQARRSGYDMQTELDLSQMRADKAALEKTIESLRVQEKNLNRKISHLEGEKDSFDLTIQYFHAFLRAEALYAQGRVMDAAETLIQTANRTSEAVRSSELIAEFTRRCASALETKGDEALHDQKYDEAALAYSTALSLGYLTPILVLTKWAKAVSTCCSVNEALGAAEKFKLPKFVIFRAVCDALETNGRVTDAITCYRQMDREPADNTSFCDERAQWEPDFLRRCVERLENLGDTAMDSQNYNVAAKHFSETLSLNPSNRTDILIKRSKARILMNWWEEALNDADEVIKIYPSCYQGYELRHKALHGAQRYVEAVEAFNIMLSRLDASLDIGLHRLRCQYVDARPIVRMIVQQTIRHMPRVLIDTATGCLYDKQRQADAFESLPIYSELVSSMTAQVDDARIRRAVEGFYQYVMLSHRWEHGEPLFQDVKNISIHDLKASPANTKLQRFCSLARSLGFQWAWSDNSCVDKLSNVVLQESLVAMFTWYRGSSLTIVYLRGVWSGSQVPGELLRSIWNTRAWTYQEYVAAETIRFYTEDWKPYLGLNMSNHKESPVIISEMQQATGVSTQETAVLRPGLDMIREKLYLASRRETTLVEDAAYSLFGIFNVALPIIYGEGTRAVGRLLEHILTGSGDVTLLAWTGRAGSYNSCLPMDLTVYNPLVPPHVPRPIEKTKMDRVMMTLPSSLADPSFARTLYDRVNNLPSPSLSAKRLRLPGIVFPFIELVHTPESDPNPTTKLHTYHASIPALRDIEIRTADELTGKEGLCLVHPWIRPLLDQEFSHRATSFDETTRALRLVARLRQPFGALIFEQLSSVVYRRVATDCLVMAQIRDEASLTQLMTSIRTIEVQ